MLIKKKIIIIIIKHLEASEQLFNHFKLPMTLVHNVPFFFQSCEIKVAPPYSPHKVEIKVGLFYFWRCWFFWSSAHRPQIEVKKKKKRLVLVENIHLLRHCSGWFFGRLVSQEWMTSFATSGQPAKMPFVCPPRLRRRRSACKCKCEGMPWIIYSRGCEIKRCRSLCPDPRGISVICRVRRAKVEAPLHDYDVMADTQNR